MAMLTSVVVKFKLGKISPTNSTLMYSIRFNLEYGAHKIGCAGSCMLLSVSPHALQDVGY